MSDFFHTENLLGDITPPFIQLEGYTPLTGEAAAQEFFRATGWWNEIWVKLSWEQDREPPHAWALKKDGSPAHYVYTGTVTSAGEFPLTLCEYAGKDERGTTIWKPTKKQIADGFVWLRKASASGATIYLYPNQPTGGISNAHVTETNLVFYEIDDLPLAGQREALKKLCDRTGLQPVAVVYTGGKSLHVYFRLEKAIAVDHWMRLNRKLTVLQNSDPTICNAARAMRFPGLVRQKLGKDGPELVEPKEITLEFSSEASYSAEVFEAALDSTGSFPHGLSSERWSLWQKAKRKAKENNLDNETTAKNLEEILQKLESELSPKPQYKESRDRTFQSEDSATRPSQYESRDRDFTYDGSTIPLEECLTKDDRALIQNGTGSGGRDNAGYKLARNLIGTANQLSSLGIRYSDDPRSLFEEFCGRCNPPLPSRDIERIWRSASKGTPSASLTDDALKNCIAAYQYHQNAQSFAGRSLSVPDSEEYAAYVRALEEEKQIEAAISLEERRQLDPWALTEKADLWIDRQFVGDLPELPKKGLVFLASATGTGKTESINPIVAEALKVGRPVLVVTNRVTTGRELGERYGIPYVDDAKSCEQGRYFGFSLCIESLHPEGKGRVQVQSIANPENIDSSRWAGALVIYDECDQSIGAMLDSSTCRANRPKIWETFQGLNQDVIGTDGLIIAMSADVSDLDVEFFAQPLGVKPWICRNKWRPPNGYKVNVFPSKEGVYKEALDKLKNKAPDKCVWFSLEGQKSQTKWGTQTLERKIAEDIPGIRILRIDAETLAEPDHPAYGSIKNLNEIVKDYDLILTSTSISSAVSLHEKGRFEAVFDISVGLNPTREVRQRYNRVREAVARYVFVPKSAPYKIGNGSSSYRQVLHSKQKEVAATIAQLKDFDFDIDGYDPFFARHWAKRAARINAEKPVYKEKMKELLVSEGCTWIEVEDLNKKQKKAIAAEITKERDLGWSQHCRDRAEIDIEGMTRADYEALEKKTAKTKEERDKAAKFRVSETYGIEPSADLIKKDDKGWYPALRLHYWLTRDLEYVKLRDRQHLTKHKERGRTVLQDIRVRTGAVLLLREIGVTELLDPSQTLTAEHPVVVSVLERAAARKWDVKDFLGINLTTELMAKPIQLVQLLLSKLELKLESRRYRVDGVPKRSYTYIPPSDERIQIFEVWEERDLKSLEKRVPASCIPTPLPAPPDPTPVYIEINNRVGSITSNLDLPEVGAGADNPAAAFDPTPLPAVSDPTPRLKDLQVGAVVRWIGQLEEYVVTAVRENYVQVKSLLSCMPFHTSPHVLEVVREAIA